MNGADALCETLLAADIDVCFSNPGTSEMHFVAALDRQPRMRCVLGLFEGVVTGAADGYARMAEKPAATLLHLGPGLANGLANLHNAKRAGTPMLNIIGDHATFHRQFDAPLTSDIEMLARPMSHWVHSVKRAEDVSRDAASAIAAAREPPGHIATLILPADAAWGEARSGVATIATPAARRRVGPEKIREAAKAIRSNQRAALLLSDVALRASALAIAGRIAEATGVRLLAQQSNARMERGAGRVAVDRLPFPIDQALAILKDIHTLILVGANAPVSFFAYPGKPSVLTREDCQILHMAVRGDDLADALACLADDLGITPAVRPAVLEVRRPPLPTGRLTTDAITRTIAALMPENAIVCDESVTSGRQFYNSTRHAPPHDYLQLTGGAIGLGLPLVVGAAIACRERKVIGLQADGSAMYTVQALWTLAREQLDAVIVVFSNRSYAILYHELKSVGAGEAGRNARRMLDIDEPALAWTELASAMGVEAIRTVTAEEFSAGFRNALSQRGPFLIEAVL
jgi:acetolactate synthase I/II/III large subunit